MFTGVFLLLVGGIIAGLLHKPAGESTVNAMKKSDLPLNDDGSVKLFDKLSKYCEHNLCNQSSRIVSGRATSSLRVV